jgi:hypothetical protein
MKMKRMYLVFLPLAGLTLFFFFGCNKDEESQSKDNESANSLVYEDKSLLEEVSPYFYDNHICRIELLGANLERERIIRAALDQGVEEAFLLIEEAQKFFFNHTEVIMYSIPTIDPEQTVIIYETVGFYQVSMTHFGPTEGGVMSFTMKTMDDRDYFSLKLDDENRIGDLKVSENEMVKTFNETVYSLTLGEESQEFTAKGATAACCRKESSWSDCMECTTSDCLGSWLCKITGIIAPKELIAGIAVSCIGAGPDARC